MRNSPISFRVVVPRPAACSPCAYVYAATGDRVVRYVQFRQVSGCIAFGRAYEGHSGPIPRCPGLCDTARLGPVPDKQIIDLPGWTIHPSSALPERRPVQRPLIAWRPGRPGEPGPAYLFDMILPSSRSRGLHCHPPLSWAALRCALSGQPDPCQAVQGDWMPRTKIPAPFIAHGGHNLALEDCPVFLARRASGGPRAPRSASRHPRAAPPSFSSLSARRGSLGTRHSAGRFIGVHLRGR